MYQSDEGRRQRGRKNAGIIVMLMILLCFLAGLLIWLVKGQGQKRVAYETSPAQVHIAAEQEAESRIVLEGAGQPAEETAETASGEMTETASQQPAPEPVTLLFAGDVYLSNHVLNAYDQAGGIRGVLDDSIRQEIAEADYFMVNQEFPFSDRGTAAEDKQFTFRLPVSRIPILQEMGIDMVTLANNHALDFGTEALLDTCAALEQAGIRYVGAGPDLERAKRLETVEIKGKTIGFLGATRVIPVYSWTAGAGIPGMFSAYDPAPVLEEIQKAKGVCDYLVIYVHWGVERSEQPEAYQRTMGRQFIDAGADLVIGSHPHVLQGIEYYKDKPIVYSLGNFVFGSSIPQTMLLKAVLEEDGARLEMLPCQSAAGFTTRITDSARILEFQQKMEALGTNLE